MCSMNIILKGCVCFTDHYHQTVEFFIPYTLYARTYSNNGQTPPVFRLPWYMNKIIDPQISFGIILKLHFKFGSNRMRFEAPERAQTEMYIHIIKSI
jgi:hypothetical protein